MTTLLNAMQLRDVRFGLETMCVGGGQGMAIILERGRRGRVLAARRPVFRPISRHRRRSLSEGRQVAAVVLSSGEDNAAKGTSLRVVFAEELSRTTGIGARSGERTQATNLTVWR